MFLWFLLRDERRARLVDGWQSGLLTESASRSPPSPRSRSSASQLQVGGQGERGESERAFQRGAVDPVARESHPDRLGQGLLVRDQEPILLGE